MLKSNDLPAELTLPTQGAYIKYVGGWAGGF